MHNAFFYWAGLLVLAAAKAKHLLEGASSSSAPKALDATDIQHCIESDMRTITDWLSSLEAYTHGYSVEGQNVLELRPSADLGIGLYLLAKWKQVGDSAILSSAMSQAGKQQTTVQKKAGPKPCLVVETITSIDKTKMND